MTKIKAYRYNAALDCGGFVGWLQVTSADASLSFDLTTENLRTLRDQLNNLLAEIEPEELEAVVCAIEQKAL